jgi:ribose transport system substrate-binding protein
VQLVRRAGMSAAASVVATSLAALVVVAPGLGGGARQSTSPDVAGARRQIERFTKLPAFVEPGPAFDAAASLRGKTIFEIPITSEVPFLSAVERGMRQAAAAVGAKLVVYPNQGQPSQWAQGIRTAIARKASAITLFAQDPGVLGPQIREAEKAGIPVVVVRTTGEGEPCESDAHGVAYGSACVPGPFEQAGRLEADWVIQATHGKGDALVITSLDAHSTGPLLRGLKNEFANRCMGCKVRTVDVPVADWASRIPTEVQSALVRDPSIDYVIPIYDSMSQFVIPALRAAHATGRVSIATFNGTPFVLKLLQDGDGVSMDAGEDLGWVGWATMDQTFRIVAGRPPVRSEDTPLRVFDALNAGEAGHPPSFDTGYGRPYVIGYRKLWHARR